MRRRSFLAGALGAAAFGAAGRLGTVAYIQRDGLWIRDLPHGPPRRLVLGSNLGSPQFSPSGRWISYFRNDVLQVVSLDGALTARLNGAQPGATQWWPRRARGGTPLPLDASTLLHPDMLSLSPPQDRLAFCHCGGREQWEHQRIAILELNSARVSFLTEASSAAVTPAWSPAGNAIAYSAAPGPAAPVGSGEEARRLLARRRIWITDVSGNNRKALTADDRYRDEEPEWSATGSHILFCRMDSSNRKSLWLIEADGTNPVRLAALFDKDSSGLGYYGYISWRNWFDWFRA